ncbi:transcription antitermination factor NusB [Novisyntrophococcus fermenticellae]|uniref:transcription antitermination factor NusB n=1 Tax=Novisyntrophococcus fermenticellae TaxID=2068655 RepID=UPI001E5F9628|nr:transcription antitermination factor NusB [Novisyntrophococcus fermenticellae]
MKRSELRESIFKLLFMDNFNRAEEMPEQLTLYFDTLDREQSGLSEQDQAYMEQKYRHVHEHLDSIDKLLNDTASGWKISRMSKVDLNILRLAVYEMVYDDEIPVRVAINEAVEIAKRFGGDDSASFINGILGSISREQSEK